MVSTLVSESRTGRVLRTLIIGLLQSPLRPWARYVLVRSWLPHLSSGGGTVYTSSEDVITPNCW